MDISYAAIAITYYIVHGRPMPDDMPFADAALRLDSTGHYTLLICCNEGKVVEAYSTTDLEPAVALVSKIALEPYRLRDTDYLGVTRYLWNMREPGGFAKRGATYGGHVLKGGAAPKEAGSLGSVHTLFGDSYPANALGLEWR